MILNANVPIRVVINRRSRKHTEKEFGYSHLFCPSLEGLITHYMPFNTEDRSTKDNLLP